MSDGMIRPERDPHWLLGVEHGREGAEPYTFQDAENQRRYVEGYQCGTVQRGLAALPKPAPQSSIAGQLYRMQHGPLAYGGTEKP